MSLLASRRTLLWIIGVVGLLGAAASAAIVIGQEWARQRLRLEVGQVREAMSRGRLPAARRSLEGLSRRWPREGEVLHLLGQCEELAGHPEAAITAWEQVPPGDPSFVAAVESLGGLLINQGRFTPAEQTLLRALRTVPESGRFPVLRAWRDYCDSKAVTRRSPTSSSPAGAVRLTRATCSRTSGRTTPSRSRSTPGSISSTTPTPRTIGSGWVGRGTHS